MGNIADVPLGQGWPAGLNEAKGKAETEANVRAAQYNARRTLVDDEEIAEAEGDYAETHLTQLEIATLKQIIAIAPQPGMIATACDKPPPYDNHRQIVYMAGELEGTRCRLLELGYVETADIIDEAISDMMRRWFDMRGRD